ncbi:MAG: SDR family NAD(P)-dependent oxidoreductase [Polaribacter sp.]|nr:SDR family NAD(P)-dependent oxidoreductase [Polaribacter sp.]MDG1811563.1 SDR family NAD(P)-dependent oxidoreductase [Polaribacter sp.]MDG1994787.1 SDR family NAD(P)-dependent oxidoreductase [Polaribacter sp.]
MKTVLIIGGSSGIGKSLAYSILDSVNVISLSRTTADINHVNFKEHLCDVLNDDLPEIDTIDALVYCPGSINLKPITRLKQEDFLNDFSINILGAVRVIQQYLSVLKNSSTANILMFSSVATKLGMPFHASVAASKGAVEGLVKSLAAELAPVVRVNAIAPTLTDTNLASKLLRNDRLKEMSAERHPLKNYLQPEEVAEMASFIISEKAKSLSGQIFEMDYGIVNLKV